MTERDAFGRLPDENTLAGLGVPSGDFESVTSAEPVVAADAAREASRGRPREPARRGPSPRHPPSRRRPAAPPGLSPVQAAHAVRRVIKTLFVLFVLAMIAGFGVTVFRTATSVTDTIRDFPSKVDGDGARNRARSPIGLQPRSMLLPRNLSAAVRRLRTGGLGRLRSLRIAPERVDAQLLTRDGRLRSVQARFDGELSTLSTSGAGFGGLPTIPFSQINSAAPARLARSAADRLRRPVTQVDYVARINAGQGAAWTVVMRGGGQFLGDSRGRITRRIN